MCCTVRYGAGCCTRRYAGCMLFWHLQLHAVLAYMKLHAVLADISIISCMLIAYLIPIKYIMKLPQMLIPRWSGSAAPNSLNLSTQFLAVWAAQRPVRSQTNKQHTLSLLKSLSHIKSHDNLLTTIRVIIGIFSTNIRSIFVSNSIRYLNNVFVQLQNCWKFSL